MPGPFLASSLASDTRAIFAPTSGPAPLGAGFLFRGDPRTRTVKPSQKAKVIIFSKKPKEKFPEIFATDGFESTHCFCEFSSTSSSHSIRAQKLPLQRKTKFLGNADDPRRSFVSCSSKEKAAETAARPAQPTQDINRPPFSRNVRALIRRGLRPPLSALALLKAAAISF